MINIISSCTNSKKYNSDDLLKIASIDNSITLEDSIQIWKQNLQKAESKKFKASHLYKGGVWKATMDLKSVLDTKYETNLYIASAGYGLINSQEEICSYDSTFATGTPNSISKFNTEPSKKANIQWWDSINSINSNYFSPKDYFFIILPYDYLIATQNFIHDLIKNYHKNIFIFTANKLPVPGFMEEYIVKIDSRFNSFQTGVMTTLLQRSVLWLSNEIVSKNISLIHKDLQNHINKKLSDYPVFTMPKRKQLTEKELDSKIRSMVLQDNIMFSRQGLKQLRDEGFACEQKRFSKTFNEIKSELI